MTINKLSTTDMTSRELAKLTGKEHKNVLRDIAEMAEAWNKISQPKFEPSNYRARGKVYPQYIMNKSQALYVVSKYSNEIRAALINRLEYLENKEKERQESKLEFQPMTDAIRDSNLALGKEPMFYHYTNESNLINRIVLGCTASKWKLDNDISKEDSLRDTLTAIQIKAINHVQKNNTALIELGFEYNERKVRLTDLFNNKYKAAIMSEFISIES